MSTTQTEASLSPKISEKERIDALFGLAQFRFERWKNRREHEWRISAALWALLAGAIASRLHVPIPLLVAIVLLHAFWWVRWNYVRNQRDIRRAFEYIEKIDHSVTGAKPSKPQQPSWFREWYEFLFEGVTQFQMFTTILLTLTLYFVGSPHSSPP